MVWNVTDSILYCWYGGVFCLWKNSCCLLLHDYLFVCCF